MIFVIPHGEAHGKHMVIEILELVAIVGVAILVRFYLPSYFKKKGENLATKEDIGGIEREIQEVRSKYSQDLELLRSELTKKSYIYGVRYENEFTLLKELWSNLVDLKRAAISLRPAIDYTDSSDQDEKERRLKRVHSAIIEFLDVADKNQPFFPQEIYTTSLELMKIANKEKIQYKNRNPNNDPSYWDSATKHAEEISVKVDILLKLIRNRITSYE